ncbi:hypothetical protein [Radiobacillus deserti]|uniref:Uncharacterized protein n=1 Tax=Radiobacillus deserti TaxID=2594883 RepID=A0A516KC20_9BACI|nr:hypothetical protein [Radiobacillus deserti]QDP38938.1 hypothetical protein FN924_01120 [Radiobacillus deserti]
MKIDQQIKKALEKDLDNVKITFEEWNSLNEISTKTKSDNKLFPIFSILAAITVACILIFNSNVGIEDTEETKMDPQKENIKSSDAVIDPIDGKEELLDRVFNSINYYDTLEGGVEVSGEDYTLSTEFGLDLTKQKFYETSQTEVYDAYTVSDGKTLYTYTSDEGVLREEPLPYKQRNKNVKIEMEELVNANENIFNYRDDFPDALHSKLLIFPQELLVNLLIVNRDWSIEGFSEKKSGRDSVKIVGTVGNKEYDSFGIYFDRTTGLPLEYKLLKGQTIIKSVKYRSLSINQEINSKFFSKSYITEKVNGKGN